MKVFNNCFFFVVIILMWLVKIQCDGNNLIHRSTDIGGQPNQ